MNNKLYIYGCSHSAGNLLGYNHSLDSSLYELANGIRFVETDYTKWLGSIGVPFFINLSKELNLEWVLRAQGGNSNQQQFKKLLNDLHLFNKDDTIIFQFTHFIRFEVPIKNGEYWISDGWQKGGSKVFSDPKYQNFYLTHIDFEIPFIIEIIKQILSLINYIRKKIGARVYIWTIDEISEEINKNTKLLDDPYLINFEIDNQRFHYLSGVTNSVDRNETLIIKHETKGLVDDMHFGQLGHDFMYKNILNFIKKVVN